MGSRVCNVASVEWSSKLAGVVETKTGERLTTLRYAAKFIQARFSRVIKDAALEGAVEDLIIAAESGKKADCDQATSRLKIFLYTQRMLAGAGRARTFILS